MRQYLRRFIPPADELRSHRWLRWLGPTLHRPWLWRASRRGIALGVALGLFFGVLFPIAQIPFSAAAAVVLRANLPAAVASTLVTNPATFGPIYYAAWRLGSAVLGHSQDAPVLPPAAEPAPLPQEGWIEATLRRLQQVGKPLMLGLVMMAAGAGVLSYFVVSWAWTARVVSKRRRRRSEALRSR